MRGTDEVSEMRVADAGSFLESVGTLCELPQVVESLFPQQVLLLGGLVCQEGQGLLGDLALYRVF